MTDVVEVERSPLLMPGSRNPTGWACVSWSDELPAGEVQLKQYFGKQIALWRGESGTPYATDAYCLHLGANLAVGGHVEGEDIVCPWHNWHWDGEGCNTHIPYSSQSHKPNVRIERYQVMDWNGMLLLWHDERGRDPLWMPPELPELQDGSMYPIDASMRVVHRIKAHPQMAMENGADPFHVRVIHGGGETPEFETYDFIDHSFHAKTALTYGAGYESTWLTPDGPVRATTDFMSWGLMLGAVRWPPELISSMMMSSFTPVDDQYMDYWFCMSTVRGDTPEPSGVAAKMIKHQMKVIIQDFFTWENMKVLPVPNLAPEETKYLVPFRRWARQFYAEFETPVSVRSAGADE